MLRVPPLAGGHAPTAKSFCCRLLLPLPLPLLLLPLLASCLAGVPLPLQLFTYGKGDDTASWEVTDYRLLSYVSGFEWPGATDKSSCFELHWASVVAASKLPANPHAGLFNMKVAALQRFRLHTCHLSDPCR